MKVLIVAKTRVGTQVCVGGLDAKDRSVRLLEADGTFPPSSTYEIGQVWEVKLIPAPDLKPPHIEDMLVQKRDLVGVEPKLAAHLRGRVKPWAGSVTTLFEGKLGFTGKMRGYIDENDIPSRSTWFWLPDKALQLVRNGNKAYYRYDGYELSYVGVAPPIQTIPVKTLVRVSLARWWKPRDAADDFPERCYLQLSGWYT